MKKYLLLIIIFILIILGFLSLNYLKNTSNNPTYITTEITYNNDESSPISYNKTNISIVSNPIINNENNYDLSFTLKIENTDNQEILEPYFDYIIYDSNETILNTSITSLTSKTSSNVKNKTDKLIDHTIVNHFDSELTNSNQNISEFNLYSTINNDYSISYPIHIVVFDLKYKTETQTITSNNQAFKFNIKK